MTSQFFMQFSVNGNRLSVSISDCIVAGWTGRDRAVIDHHIAELAKIGVAPPSTVPLYYRISPSLLTQERVIQVVGDSTSGEVEPLVLRAGGKTYLGLASDHTDRALEAHSVALSKQVCAKPCAPGVWDFDSVAGHLDSLELSSWVRENGDWTLYQNGKLASLRPLAELIEGAGLDRIKGDAAMLGGTFGVVSGGVRPAPAFRMEMHDPLLDRTISHEYAVVALPLVS